MTKYHARKVHADGHIFDSQAEYNRYRELYLLQLAGEISGLRRADSYVLIPKFKRDGRTYRAVNYTPDFTYTENGRQIVEEVKSEGTKKARDYQIRIKLFLVTYPDIVFKEVLA